MCWSSGKNQGYNNRRREADLRLRFLVHKKRASMLYEWLKEDVEDTLTFSFNCQKNIVLPKLSDEAAYYLHKMYLYNFTLCQGNSHSSQTMENLFVYTWLETDFVKSLSQIASAIHQNLSQQADFEDIMKICLFADRCGGQN